MLPTQMPTVEQTNTKIDFEVFPAKAGDVIDAAKVKDVIAILAKAKETPLDVDSISSDARVLDFNEALVSLEQKRDVINVWQTNLSTCNEGYRGRVCSGCTVSAEISQSFKKSSGGECSKCPEVWASVLSLFAVVTAFVAWMCFAIQLALRGAKNAAGRHSQLFKSLLSHVQVAALAKDFDLQ